MTRERIVLVGRRKAAANAVRDLGFRPIEITQQAGQLQARRAYGGTTAGAGEAARHLLAGARPAAVIAVAEGAVPAAAALRAHYGLGGITPTAAERCHDKIVMKRALSAAGIRCAPWLAVGDETTAEELVDVLGLPLVLKVPVSSGSRGVSIARTAAEVAAAARPGMLAEGFVEGVEMSVEQLLDGGRVLFLNPTRYLEPKWANVVPARLDASSAEALYELVGAAHVALGVDSGMTHSEIFLTSDGPVFGEMAARPPGGLIMELIKFAYGFDPWRALIEVALGRQPTLPTEAPRAAGVWLLHPGPGTVAWIRGVDAARAAAGIQRVTLNVAPGDTVGTRLGTGQSVGHVLAVADDPDICGRELTAAARAISFDLLPE